MPHFAALTRLQADLDAIRPVAADQVQPAQVAWSFHAGVPAGHSLTLPETEALLLHGLTAASKPLHEQLALRQHHAAVQFLEAVAHSGQPLTEGRIGLLHGLLLGLPTGTHSPYKTQSNDVLTATGTVRYFARPDDVPARMAGLLAWYRQAPALHPVALAATFHHRLLRIGPFATGNGRLARLLLGLVLRHHGYPAVVIKPTDWDRYQAALAAADVGEPEALQHFVAEAVAATLRQQLRTAKGEPGYALDDLQAKLALLKQQVLGQEDAVATLWNEDVQQEVYEALLRFWLDNLNQQTQSFDELFMTLGYAGSVASALPQPVALEEEGDLEAFKALFKTAIATTHSEITTVAFSKKWYHFRQRNNGFAVGLRATFHFRLDHFTVSEAILTNYSATGPETHWENEALNAVYLPAYDEQRIHEINHLLAAKLYDFIAAKVAEATATAG